MDHHRRGWVHRLPRGRAVPRQGDRVVVVDNLSRRGADAQPRLAPRARGHRVSSRPTSATLRDDGRLMAGTPTPTPSSTWPARSPSPPAWPTPAHDFETNALGTFNVLEAVRTAASGQPGRPLQLDQQGLRQPRARPRRRARRPLRLRGPARSASTSPSRSTSTAPTAARRGAATSTSATTRGSTG